MTQKNSTDMNEHNGNKHRKKRLLVRGMYYPVSFALLAVVLGACSEKKAPPPDPASIPVPVNLYGVSAAPASWYERFPGSVVAMMQVDVRSVIEGYVTGIYFKEGEHVTRGQKLYAIDDSKYQAGYNQVQANIRVAEANVAQAQKDADRYNYLNEHDAVAKQTLDHALTTLQNAKSQLAAAKQELAKAQTDIGYSVIKAPFDGTIGISQVRLGNVVVPGQTVMNTISTDGPTAVDIVVNEKQIPLFVRLQKQKHNALDSMFTLLLADNSTYPYPGKIAIIDRGVNPQTGTITVRLDFPNPDGMLRAGMSCTVRMRNDDTAKQMMVPAKAIVQQMGEYFVYVAKDTAIPLPGDADKKPPPAPVVALHALQRRITPGQTIADRVVVRAGIQDGDSIVADGVQKLRDGALITSAAPGTQKK
jgi:membrane fusion protein (multidrug efflux system)